MQVQQKEMRHRHLFEHLFGSAHPGSISLVARTKAPDVRVVPGHRALKQRRVHHGFADAFRVQRNAFRFQKRLVCSPRGGWAVTSRGVLATRGWHGGGTARARQPRRTGQDGQCGQNGPGQEGQEREDGRGEAQRRAPPSTRAGGAAGSAPPDIAAPRAASKRECIPA